MTSESCFNDGLRYFMRYGIAWWAMPNDALSWFAVYRQSCCWKEAGCFEAPIGDR
ncbi:hypothetical protein PT277_02865 [Acetobacteraceae bacterium ESL0709]|nr:hypothetical protein [Acetobacteraceae bacterium ESL0697]MDF7677643.1 hypothetical protein [Acetobacteraceae bacterium ESL0709]